MKIKDIIVENELRKGSQYALPDAESLPDLNLYKDPYAAYRFGLALAGSPENMPDKNGPNSGDMMTIGYSDADKEKIDAAKKKFGIKKKRLSTGKGSEELPNVGSQSPVAKPKRNKYGV